MLERFANLPDPLTPEIPWATLAAGVNSSATTLTLDVPWRSHSRGLIGSEIVVITAGYGTTSITVTRGGEGTAAASHTSGAGLFGILTAAGLLNSPGPLTATGDLPYLAAGGSMARLAAGSDGHYLQYAGGLPITGPIQAAHLPDLSTVYQPLDPDLTAIAALTGTGGWAQRTGSNTWAISTPTASDVAALSLASPWNLVSAGAAGTYTLANSGIVVKNAGGDEVLRIWGTDPDVNNWNSRNLYIGYQAGIGQPTDNVSAGYSNVGLGTQALHAVTTGNNNVAIGPESSYALTTGRYNMTLGRQSGYALTTGNNNVAIGQAALTTATSPSYSTAIGTFALYYAQTGDFNTALGAGALSKLTTGIKNTMVGAILDIDGNGSPPIVTGSNNSILGFDAGPTGDYSNTLSLGAGAAPTASNLAVIGNASVTGVYLGGATGLATLFAAAVNKVAITAPASSATLTIADGKTFTVNQTLTLTGTTGTTMTFPATSATIARTDAANTFTGVQTMTSPALTTPAIATGAVITEAVGTSGLVITGATQTSSFPALSATQIWNNSGTSFKGVLLNVTNTASASGARLFELQVASSAVFGINVSGQMVSGQIFLAGSFGGLGTWASANGFAGNSFLKTGGTVVFNGGGSDDLILRRATAAALQMGDDVNGAAVSQLVQAANGITGTDKTGGNFTIASGKGTGAGAISSIFLQTPAAIASGTTAQTLTTRLTIDSSGIKATGYKSSDGSAGVTAGPFTTITGITVKNGIVTALTGS